jgi:hypothetical protein
MSDNRTIGRRTLLGGIGATLAGLPLLNRIPSAEAQDFPKRFIVFFTPNEAIDKEFWEPGPNMALKEMMSPLESIKSKINILGDIAMESRLDDPHPGGHIGIGHLLIGRKVIPFGPNEPDHFAGGISVDQYIANHLGMEALVLGARPGGNSGNSRLSYVGPNEPVPPIEDPLKAFDQTLGDYSIPPDELAEKNLQRRSVLDKVAGHLEGLNSKMSAADKAKLETHLDRVRDLELQLQESNGIVCEPIGPADDSDYKSNADYPVTIRKHIDVAVQTLACDVTRVATLQLGNSGTSHVTPNWGGAEGININVDAHNISHDYNNDQSSTNANRRVELEKWYFKQFRYLLDKLEAVEEGSGTMLDNSLVLWCKPIGRRHSVNEMLFLTAGSAGGQIETGRYLSLPGVPHNDLLVSCLQLMGLPDTTFGDAKYCTGPLDL